MSWNENLYRYHQKAGGQFLGSREADWDGELLLTYKDGPLVVRTVSEAQGRYSTCSIRVRLTIQLEQPYKLRIHPQSAAAAGVNTVLGFLDRGVEKLPIGLDLHRDYGCPDVTRGRAIRTNNPDFTQTVFQDLALRNQLLASPQDGIVVLPGPGEEGLHLVECYSYPSALNSDWDLGDSDWMDPQQQQDAALREESFSLRLDRLIDLTRAAAGAVNAWRMPPRSKNPKSFD